MIVQRRKVFAIGASLVATIVLVVIAGHSILVGNGVTNSIQSQQIAAPSTLLELDQIPVTPHAILTSAQVLSYVGTSAFIGGPTLSGQPPTILVCRKMSVGEAESTLRNTIADDKSAFVFLVELQGPFTVPHASHPHRQKVDGITIAPSVVANKAYEVFDAQTGDVLLWGILDDGSSVPTVAQTAVAKEGLIP